VRSGWRIAETRRLTLTLLPERRRLIWARLAHPEHGALTAATLHATAHEPAAAARDVERAARAACAWSAELPLVFGGDLPRARAVLPSLAGRDPSGLGAGELTRATVESVAENTSDAAVAPLFWGAVAGVPGLLVYRAVNTLDAMVGHRSPRYERFGWAAARLDDVANWPPARLTAALTVACAPLSGGSGTGALTAWREDGAAHPSPNAGRCEAALAGAHAACGGGSGGGGSSRSGRGRRSAHPRPHRGVAIEATKRLRRAVVLGLSPVPYAAG